MVVEESFSLRSLASAVKISLAEESTEAIQLVPNNFAGQVLWKFFDYELR